MVTIKNYFSNFHFMVKSDPEFVAIYPRMIQDVKKKRLKKIIHLLKYIKDDITREK